MRTPAEIQAGFALVQFRSEALKALTIRRTLAATTAEIHNWLFIAACLCDQYESLMKAHTALEAAKKEEQDG